MAYMFFNLILKTLTTLAYMCSIIKVPAYLHLFVFFNLILQKQPTFSYMCSSILY